ncbi:MAG TPA: MaoC family dehydratase [Gaiellaceae bacterium]|nr:MaoC family dehydratase [Gaiellaceae bacterium]
MEHQRAFGRWLDEFVIGDVYHHGPGRTLTDFDNIWSSLLALDPDPRWIDHSAARRAGVRLPINPMLVFSIAVSMSIPDVSGRGIGNLGYDELRQHQDVFAGDTIYARSTVLDVRPSRTKPDRGPVYVLTEALNQDGIVVLSVRRRTMVQARPQGEPQT